MKKMIKKIVTVAFLILLTGGMFGGSAADAKAAGFKKEKIKINLSENNEALSLDEDNNVYFYQCENDGYDAQQDKYYFHLYKYECNDTAIQNTKKIICYDKYISYVEEIEGSKNTIVAGFERKGEYHFTTYSQNGEVMSSIFDKINAEEFDHIVVKDIYIKGKRLYYAYAGLCNNKKCRFYRCYEPHIRCINVDNGELINDKFLKENCRSGCMKIHDDRVYVTTPDSVKSFTLNGKKERTYKTPKTENSNYGEISIKGKYLYFTGGKNGIFRCKINNAKKGFSLYYDAKKDKNFKKGNDVFKGYFYDFCVKDKNTFYMRFVDEKDVSIGGPQWMIRYTK